MRSLLEFGRGMLHYSKFSSRLRLPNPFLQFCNGLGGRGGKTCIAQGKVRGRGESQRTGCKKQ